MVARDSLDVNEKQVYESHYKQYRDKEFKNDKKNRTWYRLLFPNDAEYDTKQNTYSSTHKEDTYNPANSYYTNAGSNHFRHHLNE